MIASINQIRNRIDQIFNNIEKANENTESIKQIKIKILSLLEENVRYYEQHGFTVWRKEHLAAAISYINWNITRNHRNKFWFTACLVSLEKATTDKEEISPAYPHNKEHAAETDKLEASDFIDAIEQLKNTLK